MLPKAKAIGLLFALLILVYLLSRWLPAAVDWSDYFRPAARQLLRGASPYDIEGFPSPPWLLLPVLPLALLPEAIGRALFLLLNLGAFAYTAWRLGASPLTMFFFVLSPPVLHSLLNGNVDGLVILGFVLPPPVGLFFLSIKPQIGLGVALFWLVEAWRAGKVKQVVQTFAPVTAAWLAAFAIFGFWITRWEQEIDLWWNASAWPLSVPVGLALLVAAIRRRQIEFAMPAGVCLSPYVLLHAWVGALAALMKLPAEMAAAVLGLWLIVASLLVS